MPDLLGLFSDELNPIQMAVRAILIYAFTLMIVRLGSIRLMGKTTAFDFIVAIMLGSIMSRGVTGNSPLAPTLVSGVVLLIMHWFIGALAIRMDWFGFLTKGGPVILIRDGKIQEKGMREANLTRNDLLQALHIDRGTTDLSQIHLAIMERNGEISFINGEREPKVVDLPVRDGVKTIRIEIAGKDF